MSIRESRLLLIAVLFATLGALPLACGGNDNGAGANGDADQTGGDPSGGDPVSGGDPTGGDDATTICNDLKTKIDSCNAQILCFYDTSTFVSDCVAQGTATAQQRDNFVSSPCSAISSALCAYTTGSCTTGLQCAVIEPTTAICANSDGSAQADAATCSGTSACSDTTQICGPSGSGQSCFDTCAPPACSGGLQCTPVNATVGFVCLQASGAVPAAATTCDTSVNECSITQGCIKFDGAAHSYCVDWCFLNDGTYAP